jgi:hypothetical protein
MVRPAYAVAGSEASTAGRLVPNFGRRIFGTPSLDRRRRPPRQTIVALPVGRQELPAALEINNSVAPGDHVPEGGEDDGGMGGAVMVIGLRETTGAGIATEGGAVATSPVSTRVPKSTLAAVSTPFA